MTTVRLGKDEDGVTRPYVERTVREEQAQALRDQGKSLLIPLVGDGEKTRECMVNIRAFIDTVEVPERYADKVAQWRRDLRDARYADWLAARDAKK